MSYVYHKIHHFKAVYFIKHIHRVVQITLFNSIIIFSSPEKETLYLKTLYLLAVTPLSHSPQFSSVQFSRSVVSDTLRPHGLRHTRLPCPSLTPGAYSNSRPSCRWCHSTISSSVIPFPIFNLSQHQGLFQWVSSLHQVAKILEFQLQHQSFQWIFSTDFL